MNAANVVVHGISLLKKLQPNNDAKDSKFKKNNCCQYDLVRQYATKTQRDTISISSKQIQNQKSHQDYKKD